MRLSDTYDLPDDIACGDHSPAFREFLWNWFGDTRALTMGEVDISFLDNLTPQELTVARSLIRRNLGLRYNHIIQGAAALHDVEAAPLLREMLGDEPDESRGLIIAGALWNLVRDPVFVTRLYRAKSKGSRLLIAAHLYQVLWLDDGRAVDFLIDLMDRKELRPWALPLLNELEFGRQTRSLRLAQKPHQPDDYRVLQLNPAFREKMTAAVRRWNREVKTGMTFGWWEGPAAPSGTS